MTQILPFMLGDKQEHMASMETLMNIDKVTSHQEYTLYMKHFMAHNETECCITNILKFVKTLRTFEISLDEADNRKFLTQFMYQGVFNMCQDNFDELILKINEFGELNEHEETMLFDMMWLLINIFSYQFTDKEHFNTYMDHKDVRRLITTTVEFIKYKDTDISVQAIWLMSNIIGDDIMMNTKTQQFILTDTQFMSNLSFAFHKQNSFTDKHYRELVWIISNFTRRDIVYELISNTHFDNILVSIKSAIDKVENEYLTPERIPILNEFAWMLAKIFNCITTDQQYSKLKRVGITIGYIVNLMKRFKDHHTVIEPLVKTMVNFSYAISSNELTDALTTFDITDNIACWSGFMHTISNISTEPYKYFEHASELIINTMIHVSCNKKLIDKSFVHTLEGLIIHRQQTYVSDYILYRWMCQAFEFVNNNYTQSNADILNNCVGHYLDGCSELSRINELIANHWKLLENSDYDSQYNFEHTLERLEKHKRVLQEELFGQSDNDTEVSDSIGIESDEDDSDVTPVNSDVTPVNSGYLCPCFSRSENDDSDSDVTDMSDVTDSENDDSDSDVTDMSDDSEEETDMSDDSDRDVTDREEDEDDSHVVYTLTEAGYQEYAKLLEYTAKPIDTTINTIDTTINTIDTIDTTIDTIIDTIDTIDTIDNIDCDYLTKNPGTCEYKYKLNTSVYAYGDKVHVTTYIMDTWTDVCQHMNQSGFAIFKNTDENVKYLGEYSNDNDMFYDVSQFAIKKYGKKPIVAHPTTWTYYSDESDSCSGDFEMVL